MAANSSLNECGNLTWNWPPDPQERDRVHRRHAWTLIPGLAIAFPLAFLYLLATIRAMHTKVVSRKLHILLLNRTIGDLVTCLAAFGFVFHILVFSLPQRPFWVQFFNSFFTTCFWGALTTYATMGMVKLCTTAFPFQAAQIVTKKRCIFIVISSWFVFLLLMTITQLTGIFARLEIKLFVQWFGCSEIQCLQIVYKSRNAFTFALTIISILFTFICTIGTCFFIQFHRLKTGQTQMGRGRRGSEDKVHGGRRKGEFNFPMTRLVLLVTLFAIFHLPYALWHFRLLMANLCDLAQNFSSFEQLVALGKLFVLIRISADVLLTFCMDKIMRDQLIGILFHLLNTIGLKKTEIVGSNSSQKTTQTEI